MCQHNTNDQRQGSNDHSKAENISPPFRQSIHYSSSELPSRYDEQSHQVTDGRNFEPSVAELRDSSGLFGNKETASRVNAKQVSYIPPPTPLYISPVFTTPVWTRGDLQKINTRSDLRHNKDCDNNETAYDKSANDGVSSRSPLGILSKRKRSLSDPGMKPSPHK